MKYLTGIILMLALIGFGCSSDEKPVSQQQPTAQQPSPPSPPPVYTYEDPLSPTQAFKVYNDAKRNKDAAGVKKFLSKTSLILSQTTAQQTGKTLDEVVTSGMSFEALPPIRNEKIVGDTASIEIQNSATGDWEEWYLLKEDGIWKSDLNRLLEMQKRKLAEAMKQSAPKQEKTGK